MAPSVQILPLVVVLSIKYWGLIPRIFADADGLVDRSHSMALVTHNPMVHGSAISHQEYNENATYLFFTRTTAAMEFSAHQQYERVPPDREYRVQGIERWSRWVPGDHRAHLGECAGCCCVQLKVLCGHII